MKDRSSKMSKRYIKGKDGKLQGSIPNAPKFPTDDNIIVPKAPEVTRAPTPAHPSNGLIESSDSVYDNVSDEFTRINNADKVAIESLNEGLDIIGESFDIIEEIYASRLAHSQAAYDRATEDLRIAEESARSSRARYEDILLAQSQKSTVLDRFKQLLRIKTK
jgi:hypothetical protein